MRIYVMRHSETDWNRGRRIQGHSDIHLNRNGIRLAGLAGQGMSSIPFDICYTSPLARACETAAIVLSNNTYYMENGQSLIVEPRIKEIGFGVWEGLHSREEYGEINRANFEDFYLDPNGTYCPEGGERLRSVIERSNNFIDELSADKSLKDSTVLLVTHGCTIRCILSRFSDDPEYYRHPHVPYNCEAAIIDVDEDGRLTLTDPGSVYYDESLAVNFYGY
ncbi:MAG: histidine phosphatase family protein [Clostridiales bacterium]|nr:histidine phosphatase family protein [Clostridiales bacterium]